MKKGTDFASRPNAPSSKILTGTDIPVPFPANLVLYHLLLITSHLKHYLNVGLVDFNIKSYHIKQRDLLVTSHMLTAFNKNKKWYTRQSF